MATIETIAFNREKWDNSGSIFDDRVENDPALLFHGTSADNCEAIESEGFYPGASIVGRSELAAVYGIFKDLNWSGLRASGYGVIHAFSIRHDFRAGDITPIFFAEWANQAIYYATRSYAGGEKCRAVRFAIEDLHNFIENEQIRLEVSRDPDNRIDEHSPLCAKDVRELRQRLQSLESLANKCFRLRDDYVGGAVYALRIPKDARTSLGYSAFMGYRSDTPIPRERIVAKCLLPPV